MGRSPPQPALASSRTGRSRCPSCICPVGSIPRELARIGFYQSGSSIVNVVLVHIVGCSGVPVPGVLGQPVHVGPLPIDHIADG